MREKTLSQVWKQTIVTRTFYFSLLKIPIFQFLNYKNTPLLFLLNPIIIFQHNLPNFLKRKPVQLKQEINIPNSITLALSSPAFSKVCNFINAKFNEPETCSIHPVLFGRSTWYAYFPWWKTIETILHYMVVRRKGGAVKLGIKYCCDDALKTYKLANQITHTLYV